MLFFTTAMKNHKLNFVKLSDCKERLPMAAEWAEKEWGYIRNKGVQSRKERFEEMQSNIYIGFYNEQPVAMFALENRPFHQSIPKKPGQKLDGCALSYVYVQQEYRGLGFGNQIIDKVKSLALENKKTCILLDTLKPGLNTLYMKHGAEVVCESRLFGEPTQVLRMSP